MEISSDYNISFLDESREIASEYVGGKERYAMTVSNSAIPQSVVQQSETHDIQIRSLQQNELQQQQQQQQQQSQQSRLRRQARLSLQQSRQDTQMTKQISENIDPNLEYEQLPTAPPAPAMSYQELPPTYHGAQLDSGYAEEMSEVMTKAQKTNPRYSNLRQQDDDTTNTTFNETNHDQTTNDNMPRTNEIIDENQQNESRMNYLDDPDETLFMQVFVEEVGLWMDSMDPMKHVSSPNQ